MMVKLNVLYLLRLQNKRALGEMNRVRRGFWCYSSMFECNTQVFGEQQQEFHIPGSKQPAFPEGEEQPESSGFSASTCSFLYLKRHKCVLTSRSVLLRLSFSSQKRFNPPSCQALAAPALLQGFLSLFS